MQFQSKEESVRTKMESLRLACDRDVAIQQQRADSCAESFQKSLESIRTRARETVQHQEEFAKLKAKLREAEDGLVKALAVKTRTEAKRMTTVDSIATTKLRVEDLKSRVQIWKVKRDEYATIMSHQSIELATSEEKRNQGNDSKGGMQEAISWYNGVLGLRIEAGHGIKFIFKNIDVKNPNKEYSFTIRHAKDTYKLLDCYPQLNDTKELVGELNRTNGLIKFVRTMREKFQEATMQDFSGHSLEVTDCPQESSTTSLSAPVSSVSTQMSEESIGKKHDHRAEHKDNRLSQKVNHGKVAKSAFLSPESALSLRRPPRFEICKRLRFRYFHKC